MLRARLVTAAVAIPLLLVLIFAAPDRLFAAVVGAVAVVGIAEYGFMAFPGQRRDRIATIVLGSPVVTLGAAAPERVGAALVAAVVLGLVWTLLARRDFERGLADLGLMLIGILYAGFLLLHFVWLRKLDHGPYLVTFILMTAMVGDAGGYFIGHALGRHKLMPRVSPGKTVEGAIGILLLSMVAGVAAKVILLNTFAWAEVLCLAFLMGVLGQLGDLSESVMKRTFGVKESGWIFPGHGGVLDRIDSLLFPVSFVYYYSTLIR